MHSKEATVLIDLMSCTKWRKLKLKTPAIFLKSIIVPTLVEIEFLL